MLSVSPHLTDTGEDREHWCLATERKYDHYLFAPDSGRLEVLTKYVLEFAFLQGAGKDDIGHIHK